MSAQRKAKAKKQKPSTAIVLRQGEAIVTTPAPAKPRAKRRPVEYTYSVITEPFKRSAESVGDALAMASYRGHLATVEGWTLTCKRCKVQGTISTTGYEGELFADKGCGN